jgi:predicted lipoprotein with Yx(FWY)xxD motif
MPVRRALIAILATFIVAACTGGPPGATPTNQPAGTPTNSATAGASPTLAASASPSGSASTRPTPCDPYYDVCEGTSSPTPPPAQGSFTISAITYGGIGTYLAGPTRLALYTFDNDSAGSSSCTASCAETWPPLTIAMGETPSAPASVPRELGTLERDDGSLQVTYDGKPLYYYSGDGALYDTTGDGVAGVWHLARP